MNEEFDSTLSPEPVVDTTEKNPAVSVGSWLFAAMCAAFLVAVIVVSMLQRPVLDVYVNSVDDTVERLQRADGLAVYNGEGCGECHSRYVRSIDRGYGSPAGTSTLAFIQTGPGTSRIGPDIQNIATKYDSTDLLNILKRPEAHQPGTVMPSYSHLDPTSLGNLITYLQFPAGANESLSTLRALNGIEDEVPDRIIDELEFYFDPESGLFVSPVTDSPTYAITGSGIYKSRCSSCHGLAGHGYGDDTMVSPSDLTTDEIYEATDLMLYWRISDGIPGSGMPSWRGTISRDGIWYLIGNIRSISKPFAMNEYFTNDELDLLFPVWNRDQGENTDESSQEIRDNSDPTEAASEEEGASTGADYYSTDASGHDVIPDAGEETP